MNTRSTNTHKKYTITARNNMKPVDMKKVKIIRLHTAECFSPVC